MSHQENAPISITPGAIRFNTDSMKLEYFRIGMEGGSTSSYAGIGTLAAGEWVQITTDTPDIQTGGTRGCIAGGYNAPTAPAQIDYITISTTGNSQDFGNLTASRYGITQASDRTRGVFAGGRNDPTPAASMTTVDYITIASTGDAISFGSLSTASAAGTRGTLSNSTRGIFAGVENGTNSNSISYITIQSTGTPQDFGDLITTGGGRGQCCSSTRGICGGTGPISNIIEFITISTLGNSADFGDFISSYANSSAVSNSTRGVFACGTTPTSPAGIGSNIMEFITIATLGNSIDFGDLSDTRRSKGGMCSSTRGVFVGGADPWINIMEYITIMSTGNAIDFGDLDRNAEAPGALSNGHGGLG